MIEELDGKILRMKSSFEKILNDKKIIILFHSILLHGNYLNGSSIRGNMAGFKFEGLEKVIDCKSTKNTKRNLLLFIIESLSKEGQPFFDQVL